MPGLNADQVDVRGPCLLDASIHDLQFDGHFTSPRKAQRRRVYDLCDKVFLCFLNSISRHGSNEDAAHLGHVQALIHFFNGARLPDFERPRL